MSQNDLNIANQTASATRSDINSALQALGSNNSGSSAPTTTYANMHWYDTSTNILKQRSEADDAWISISYFDQSTNAFKVLDNTIVANTSGTQTGLLGDQSTSVWEAGTGTTESLVSPEKIRASLVTYIGSSPFWSYTSSQTTLSSNSTSTFTHGLGSAPSLVQIDFVCKTANNGYSVGDKIMSAGSQLLASDNRGIHVLIPNGNTTQVKILTLNQLRFSNTSGGEAGMLFTQWDVIIKAKL